MDKSFRIYNASKRSVRERKNVIFIETPSVLPEPDLVSGVDEGEITYDVYDDMVQDVRNYISNLDLASPPAADGVVGDPSCLLYTSPSPRDKRQSRMPSSA